MGESTAALNEFEKSSNKIINTATRVASKIVNKLWRILKEKWQEQDRGDEYIGGKGVSKEELEKISQEMSSAYKETQDQLQELANKYEGKIDVTIPAEDGNIRFYADSEYDPTLNNTPGQVEIYKSDTSSYETLKPDGPKIDADRAPFKLDKEGNPISEYGEKQLNEAREPLEIRPEHLGFGNKEAMLEAYQNERQAETRELEEFTKSNKTKEELEAKLDPKAEVKGEKESKLVQDTKELDPKNIAAKDMENLKNNNPNHIKPIDEGLREVMENPDKAKEMVPSTQEIKDMAGGKSPLSIDSREIENLSKNSANLSKVDSTKVDLSKGTIAGAQLTEGGIKNVGSNLKSELSKVSDTLNQSKELTESTVKTIKGVNELGNNVARGISAPLFEVMQKAMDKAKEFAKEAETIGSHSAPTQDKGEDYGILEKVR